MRREGSPWTGIGTVFQREIADNLLGVRMRLLEVLVLLTGTAAVYAAIGEIKGAVSEDPFVFLRIFTVAREPLPSFITFLGFLIPIVAISLGFDSINGEFNRRTISRILAQPIYRDALLFGKFLAGLATLGIFLTALWLLFAVFWGMIVPLVTEAIAPIDPFDPRTELNAINLAQGLARLSPNTLFAETTLALLNPGTRTLGPVFVFQLQGALLGAPLPVAQSFLLIWPQLTGLIAAVVLLFTLGYVLFQRQEIRA